MKTQRIFLSGAMDVKNGSSGPSGVSDASSHERSIHGLASKLLFPVVQSHQVILVQNNGADTLQLGYDDNAPEGVDGIRVQIPAGHHTFLTDTAGGITAAYNGGPLKLILGSFHYAILDEDMNADHPDFGAEP